MPTELPATVQELRANIARDSLTRSFNGAHSEDPPDYILNDPQQIKHALHEWYERYAHEIVLLAIAAQQALNYLEQRGHKVAITGFTSSVITQPALDRFMHANLYLEELVAGTLRNADTFRDLLTLFVQLPKTR